MIQHLTTLDTLLVGGLEHGWIMTFPSYWEFHNPNWLSYFSEGLGQPPTRLVGDLTVAEAWNHGEDSGNRPKKSVLQVSESFSAISQTSTLW